jgi:AraC family transcriptional regulator
MVAKPRTAWRIRSMMSGNVCHPADINMVKGQTHSRYRGFYTGRVLWSKDQQWGDLQFSASSSSLTSGAEGAAFRKNHKLYVTVGGGTSRTVVSTEGAPRYEGRDVVGHISFIPAERQNHGWYKGRVMECLALEIPPNWVTKSLDGRELSTLEFLPATNRFDPFIFNAMTALRDEIEIGGPAGRLFAETTATLIALHLVRRYSNVGIAFPPPGPREIERAGVEHAIEFIEDNMGVELALDTLAKVANMPISSFVRGFRNTTRMSPHKYLVQRRIDRAQQLLRSSNVAIAEIAYRLGFSSQSHFSTVFRAWTGEAPARFRQRFRGK